MKADLSRNSFNQLKHYSRVLMQQGRVQLDADWNEQQAILLETLRTLAADILGTAARKDGFEIRDIGLPDDLEIRAGRFYVDGVLCQIEATPVRILDHAVPKVVRVAVWTVDRRSFAKGELVRVSDDTNTDVIATITDLDYNNKTLTLDHDLAGLDATKSWMLQRLITVKTQPDVIALPGQPAKLPAMPFLLYLDAWERVITYVQDDEIREVALGGPDTHARTRVVAQVCAITNQTACLPAAALAERFQPTNRGWLRARVRPGPTSTDPCTMALDTRTGGLENQLYRVEIHTGSDRSSTDDHPSLKWSRENGAVVFPILKLSHGTGSITVTLATLGRDDRFGLTERDFVEIETDATVLANLALPLLQVEAIDRAAMTVTLAGTIGAQVSFDPQHHPLLRRWDHKTSDQAGITIGRDNAVLIPKDPDNEPWIDLEDDVQIQFPRAADAAFRTGDYWLIPTRVATGDVIWPKDTWTNAAGDTLTDQAAIPPDGITHHYAPLAVVSDDGTGRTITSCP